MNKESSSTHLYFPKFKTFYNLRSYRKGFKNEENRF